MDNIPTIHVRGRPARDHDLDLRIALMHADGLTGAEIARRVGRSESLVSRRLHRLAREQAAAREGAPA